MVGWHHQLSGHEFEEAPGVGDGYGGLACCSPWGCKESDTSEQLNWWSLWFPQSSGRPIIKFCWPSRLDAQPLCWIPRLGSLTWGPEPSQQCSRSLVFLSSLWVTHPASVVFDFIPNAFLLPSWYGCFFVFGCWVSFFGGFQHHHFDGF